MGWKVPKTIRISKWKLGGQEHYIIHRVHLPPVNNDGPGGGDRDEGKQQTEQRDQGGRGKFSLFFTNPQQVCMAGRGSEEVCYNVIPVN